MRKLKLLAPFLMLLSGLIASCMMFYYHYEEKQFLLILVLVMLLFYLAGRFIEKKITQFVQKYEEEEATRKAQEGEVIEKEAVEQDDTATQEES